LPGEWQTTYAFIASGIGEFAGMSDNPTIQDLSSGRFAIGMVSCDPWNGTTVETSLACSEETGSSGDGGMINSDLNGLSEWSWSSADSGHFREEWRALVVELRKLNDWCDCSINFTSFILFRSINV
jgi:hypothetical protein